MQYGEKWHTNTNSLVKDTPTCIEQHYLDKQEESYKKTLLKLH